MKTETLLSREGAVKYDIVHMRDQAFSKQPLTSLALSQKTTWFKKNPFYAFFWSRMCTLSYLTGPPGLL